MIKLTNNSFSHPAYLKGVLKTDLISLLLLAHLYDGNFFGVPLQYLPKSVGIFYTSCLYSNPEWMSQ